MRFNLQSLVTIAILLVGISTSHAQAPVLDAKKADGDFAHQGEYSGDINVDGSQIKIGVQVIAMGNGSFRASGYPGGLPGDGWNGEIRHQSDGTLKDGAVEFKTNDIIADVRNDTLTIRSNGAVLGELKKTIRQSSTLGQAPPPGAIVLFDGKSADKFEGGKLDGEELVQGVTSKQKFQNFTLHLEFKLSYMPTAGGQGRANSGCYAQGRYEVQILDSFGLEGKDNECGGIYGVKKPDMNLCYPPLSWQTYDIDFTAAKFDGTGKKTADARITVRHNGELIHNDVVIPKTTTAAPVKEGSEPGPIYLQDHGNPIRFRNIWVVEKK